MNSGRWENVCWRSWDMGTRPSTLAAGHIPTPAHRRRGESPELILHARRDSRRAIPLATPHRRARLSRVVSSERRGDVARQLISSLSRDAVTQFWLFPAWQEHPRSQWHTQVADVVFVAFELALEVGVVTANNAGDTPARSSTSFLVGSGSGAVGARRTNHRRNSGRQPWRGSWSGMNWKTLGLCPDGTG
jgi:hypothetical protein